MTTNLWIEQFWYDYKLKWNPEEYGGEYSLDWSLVWSVPTTQSKEKCNWI